MQRRSARLRTKETPPQSPTSTKSSRFQKSSNGNSEGSIPGSPRTPKSIPSPKVPKSPKTPKSGKSRSKSDAKRMVTAEQAKEAEGKLQKICLRLVLGFVMIGLFFVVIYMGHIYAWGIVAILQAMIFRELVKVRYIAAAEKNIPWFRSIQWCWFSVAMLYNYGDSFYDFLKEQEGMVVPAFVAEYLKYHVWVSFVLYALLFVLSVLSLKKGYYRYQMGNFTWTVVTIGLIVGQMKYVMHNIFNGFFWFVFPVSLVVCNDCFAYFCGRALGRKFIKSTFLKISPNKTWEGFIGAFFFTSVFAFFSCAVLSKWSWMVCPVEKLQLIAEPLDCEPSLIFVRRTFDLPSIVAQYTPYSTIDLIPMQLHSIVFASFASLIAPFGGFFASAIKRTYKLKDFDSMIPGHGGVFDRMDCQLITGLFTAVYYHTFLRAATASVPRILELISTLSQEDQLKVLLNLQRALGVHS